MDPADFNTGMNVIAKAFGKSWKQGE